MFAEVPHDFIHTTFLLDADRHTLYKFLQMIPFLHS